jgi:nucleotide-binding universal stress UspA family protein
MQDRCKEKLEALRAEHFGGYPVDVLAIRDRSAVTALCDWANEHSVDLIVLGTHGLTGLSRLLLGSVSERTVRHAPCSVLVVRHPKTPSAPSSSG